jgi:hypothetical protein
MAMKYLISTLWLSPPDDLKSRIERCIDEAAELNRSKKPVYIFFRADDIAVPTKQFKRLMEIFTRHRAPLSLAVVPAWLTHARWEAIKTTCQDSSSLWCWHQHGWRHLNHERKGKKQEFGPARPASVIKTDLIRGRKRLELLMDDDFYEAFTPPWNRCCKDALELLNELGYHALSRDQDASPPTPEGLVDFQVNVDLHTRKELDPHECWDALLAELKVALLSGFCGIMIHHQRMNDAAFDFLELLMQAFSHYKNLCLVHLKDLVRLSKAGILTQPFRQ